MAILGGESFDYMGSNANNLALRGYLQSTTVSQGSFTLSARTGTGFCIVWGSGASDGVVKILDNPLAKVVQGIGMAVLGLQPNAYNIPGIQFCVNTNYDHITIVPNSNFGFSVYQDTVLKGVSANNIFKHVSWFWLEAMVEANVTGPNTGKVTVKWESYVILEIDGLHIPDNITSVGFGHYGIGGPSFSPRTLYDDWVWGDDWIGDRRNETSYPNADTADADWVPSTGTLGYACIDEPNPSDADYIEALNIGDISAFGKQNVILDTNGIGAVIPIVRALKTDAGIGEVSIGVSNNGQNAMSDSMVLSTGVSYFSTTILTNPDGGGMWTKEAVNSAILRFERTA